MLKSLDESQENRPSISGQIDPQLIDKLNQIDMLGFTAERSHTSTTFLSWHFGTIDDNLHGVETPRDGVLDLNGGDVLASPSERVAESVAEVDVAERVLHHEVARVEGALTLLEHVLDNLRLRGFLVVRVAVVCRHWVVSYDAHKEAFLAWLALDAEAVLVADWVHVLVDADDEDWEGWDGEELVDEWEETTCANFSHDVHLIYFRGYV